MYLCTNLCINIVLFCHFVREIFALVSAFSKLSFYYTTPPYKSSQSPTTTLNFFFIFCNKKSTLSVHFEGIVYFTPLPSRHWISFSSSHCLSTPTEFFITVCDGETLSRLFSVQFSELSSSHSLPPPPPSNFFIIFCDREMLFLMQFSKLSSLRLSPSPPPPPAPTEFLYYYQ